ncbi:MAG: hypothetical protein GY716_09140, partial [bacterium]|nr:hypothetical protein [bacterium]
AGYLSEAQAIERGNRETYATRLAERHGLPLSLAFSVTDNRMGLGEARRRKQRRQEPAPAEPRWSFVALLRDVPRWQIGLAIAALCLSSFQLLKSRSGSRALEPLPLPAEVLHEPVVDVGAAKEAVRRPSPAAVVVERNSEGEIVRVAGPDPRSVLITYCRSAGGNTHLRPVEVTSAVPAFAGTRLGMLRDLARVNELLAVRIRRDRRTRRWVAGDGRHAINPFQAPTLPPDAHRLPVGS